MTAPVELRETEEQWQLRVAQFARYHGWRVAHFRTASRGSGKGRRWHTPVQFGGAGFPDLVMVRPPELLIVELKTDKGTVQPNQREWLEWLGRVAEHIAAAINPALVNSAHVGRFEVHVWRPRDWDEVQERLRRRDG